MWSNRAQEAVDKLLKQTNECVWGVPLVSETVKKRHAAQLLLFVCFRLMLVLDSSLGDLILSDMHSFIFIHHPTSTWYTPAACLKSAELLRSSWMLRPTYLPQHSALEPSWNAVGCWWQCSLPKNCVNRTVQLWIFLDLLGPCNLSVNLSPGHAAPSKALWPASSWEVTKGRWRAVGPMFVADVLWNAFCWRSFPWPTVVKLFLMTFV